ncbi:hypothetical protein PBOIBFNE_02173 [Escherichia coli]|nr:fimbria/pilus periplasmic chaperone [Escherichia coli]TII71947.1 fimbrial chaperone protein FimC [Escherichia coli]TII75546.1 fimbrial chaperone protein FimC [Escherichia coli]
MRILVAGATGSIGIHVVNTAIAMGHQPVTLVRNRRKIKLLPRGTDIFYGDVSIPETLTDLPKDIVSFMATVLLLLLFACHSTIANAAVALGATRVIYPANQKQVLLPVTNNDPASVYLIQSWIENAGDQKDTQFVITPPLFSMQGKKENTLRIINATNHQLPGDRESLFWVNVKAIPAMEKDQKNENTLQLAIISRIKMFYRPTHLAMAPEEAPAMLRFRRSGSKLTLINPTPYFITVTNMKAGNSNLPNTMVPPKGEVSVDIPHAVTGDISFQTINDYGALTPRIKATMQ